MYQEIELCGHRIDACLILWEITKQNFSKSLYSFFYSPTINIWDYSVSLLKIVDASSFNVDILECMQFYVFMILIYISLMANGI